MPKPSMRKAEWIASQLDDANADDVYDALLGNLTWPPSFVAEVEQESRNYDEDFRRNNERYSKA